MTKISKNIKKIIFIAFSIFLIYQSYSLINSIDTLNKTSWVTSIVLAWIFNLFITGIFAFLGFALPTQKLLPSSYYQIKNSKRLKFFYNFFKVNIFKNFLLLTFWKNKKQQKKYFNGRFDGIQHFIIQTQKSEFGHLIPFILISMLCFFFLKENLIKLALTTFIINWIGNWYPIILQRHHRMRILKFHNHLKNRNKRHKN